MQINLPFAKPTLPIVGIGLGNVQMPVQGSFEVVGGAEEISHHQTKARIGHDGVEGKFRAAAAMHEIKGRRPGEVPAVKVGPSFGQGEVVANPMHPARDVGEFEFVPDECPPSTSKCKSAGISSWSGTTPLTRTFGG